MLELKDAICIKDGQSPNLKQSFLGRGNLVSSSFMLWNAVRMATDTYGISDFFLNIKAPGEFLPTAKRYMGNKILIFLIHQLFHSFIEFKARRDH